MSFTVDYTLARTNIRLDGKTAVVVNLAGTNLGADAVRITVDKETAFISGQQIMTREEALLAIDIIRQRIVEGNWPPTTDV